MVLQQEESFNTLKCERTKLIYIIVSLNNNIHWIKAQNKLTHIFDHISYTDRVRHRE